MQSYGDVIHGNRKLLVLLVCLTNDKSCVHVFLRYPYVTRMYSHVTCMYPCGVVFWSRSLLSA